MNVVCALFIRARAGFVESASPASALAPAFGFDGHHPIANILKFLALTVLLLQRRIVKLLVLLNDGLPSLFQGQASVIGPPGVPIIGMLLDLSHNGSHIVVWMKCYDCLLLLKELFARCVEMMIFRCYMDIESGCISESTSPTAARSGHHEIYLSCMPVAGLMFS